MKSLCLLSLLLAGTVAAQTAVGEKPCVGFVPESTSPTNVYAKEPLQAAVMLSGDFKFYASGHEGCWDVHVLSLPVISDWRSPRPLRASAVSSWSDISAS